MRVGSPALGPTGVECPGRSAAFVEVLRPGTADQKRCARGPNLQSGTPARLLLPPADRRPVFCAPCPAWSKPPIRDASCCCHPLTGAPYCSELPGPAPGPPRLVNCPANQPQVLHTSTGKFTDKSSLMQGPPRLVPGAEPAEPGRRGPAAIGRAAAAGRATVHAANMGRYPKRWPESPRIVLNSGRGVRGRAGAGGDPVGRARADRDAAGRIRERECIIVYSPCSEHGLSYNMMARITSGCA